MDDFWSIITAVIIGVLSLSCTAEQHTCRVVQSPECSIAGHLLPTSIQTYPLTEPQLAETVEDCAYLCHRRVHTNSSFLYLGEFSFVDRSLNPRIYNRLGYCTSFQYNAHTKLCQLGNSAVSTDIVEPDQGSKDIFYNISSPCFDCGDACDQQPYGQQLLDNGGFEKGLFGPWTTLYASLKPNGHNSSQAYNCKPGKNHGSDGAFYYQNGYCYLQQQVNLCQGEYYALQFDYMIVNNATNLAHITISYQFGPFSKDIESKSTDPAVWRTEHVVVLGAVLGGPVFLIHINNPSNQESFLNNEVFIDNVRVSRVPVTLKQPEVSVVRNGGFEHGFSPWKIRYFPGIYPKENYTSIVSPGIHSDHAFSTKTNTTGALQPILQQKIKTTPGSYYFFRFDGKFKASFPTWYLAVILPIASSSSFLPSSYQYQSPPSSNVPISYSFFFLAQRENTTVGVTASNADNQAPFHGTALLDNFQVLEVAKSKYVH